MTTIPDHLIDKAARVFQCRMRLAGSPPVWEDTPAHIQDVLREGASAILDAVADDLRAEAWGEGHSWGWSDAQDAHDVSQVMDRADWPLNTPNPYRQETDR